jgi:hypothetical protein
MAKHKYRYPLMDFNVIEFFDASGIEYVTEGPNTKKGNINIACPWCGDDPSHHMGVEPNKGWYGCWRNPMHRGKNLPRLLAALTPLTYREACTLVGVNGTHLDQTELESLADGSYFHAEGCAINDAQVHVEHLELPHVFRRLRPDDGFWSTAEPYIDYMRSRGFGSNDTRRVCSAFNLQYCISGWWKSRIIIPVYQHKDLVTWTGRSIFFNPGLRYMSLDNESAVMNIKHCLYNFDSAQITGGEVLFLVEGPVDVWKMDLYGRPLNCRAVGLFNMSCEDEQLELIEMLAHRYKRIVVLTDRGELVAGNAILEKLAYLRVNMDIRLGEVPKGVDDPGKLTKIQVEALCEEHLHD